ncbi:MAG: PIN domain-containing protein [Fibromonadales bacterium]|nr:PIN domain-containing protein [Fibromonadales bacterium]
MIAYFDSSVLLAILFNEERYDAARYMWETSDFWLSSFLLRIETNISLRRTYKISEHKYDDSWLPQKMNELNILLKEVHCKPMDSSIERIVVQNKELDSCKSLDAIHIATALYFKENSKEQNIIFCSFDKNMLAIAKELKFEVNPV